MDDEYEKFQRDVLMAAHQTGGRLRQVVPNQGQLSSKTAMMIEDDLALIHKVRERLADPQRVKVSTDDL